MPHQGVLSVALRTSRASATRFGLYIDGSENSRAAGNQGLIYNGLARISASLAVRYWERRCRLRRPMAP